VATPFTTKIDIPLALGRINPEMQYHWRGDGYGVYADIGEWRTPAIPKPTEAQVYAEWDAYLAEKTANETADTTLRNQIVSLAQSAVGVSIDALTANQRNALIAIMLYKAGALTNTGLVKPLNQWF
jgi:hypothetical protein